MISCAYLLGIQVSAGVLAVALTPSALPFLEETQIEQLKDAQEENNDICSCVDDVYKLCKEGQLKEAVDILYLMDQRGIPMASRNIYARLLQCCVNMRSLTEGKRVHALMDKTGFMVDTFLVNHLVNMYVKCESVLEARQLFDKMPTRNVCSSNIMIAGYAKCGNIQYARQVFDRMPERDVVSWTAIITGYTQHGYVKEALQLFQQMLSVGVKPNQFTFATVVSACSGLENLEQGKQVHAHTITVGFELYESIGNALVTMYGRCGSIEGARQLFNKMPKRNVVSWNTMISGYVKCGNIECARELFDKMPERNMVSWTLMITGYEQHGHPKAALQFFDQMLRSGTKPDQFTFASVLSACASLLALDQGMQIHANTITSGFDSDVFVGSSLINMYIKCESIGDARHIFNKMPERNVVSWTAMITAYSKNGHGEEALALFYQMQRTGIQPNQFTFASALPACANMADLEHGKEVHGSIIRCGFQADIFVGNALVDMYAKCRSIVDARQVFDEMPHQDMVSGNAMIAGYAQNENVDEALNLFQKMPERNVVTWTAMIAGCARHGRVNEALNLFQKMPERNAVSWAAMIAGFAQNGYSDEARKLYREMQLKGVKPNSDTFASVLPAYANLADLRAGKEVHEDIIRSGCVSDVFVGSALVDMYAKCGSLEDAQQVFEKMPRRDVVSWTTMIAGYAQNGHVDEAVNFFQKMPERNLVSWNAMIAGFVQNGHFDEAFKLFRHMQLTAMKPNLDTFASVLPACANLAALHEGKEVHVCIITSGYQIDVFVGSALVDMYAKCGSIEDARKMFDNMLARDVVSWTAMIVGYAMHGYGKEAIKVFEQMQHSGTKPDHITFVGVLSACCHAGLVDDGWQYFECMRQNYHITPAVEHYCCMIDLLGRAGCLDEALDFVNKMPIKPDAAVWGSLLGACRNHTNIKLGQHVAECLFEADPKNAAHYVLLSNIYAAAGRWDDAEMVRKMMRDRRIKKLPGCSWIEVNYKVHTFFIGDRSHPETHNIYAMLKRLSGQMKEAGYAPNMDFVLHDVEEEQKDHVLCQHSEKLAIAFGLLQTCPGTTIRIVKNLRVCGDCHTATKFISKIVAREIVVRDVNRFHHFKDGYCSCGDYW